MKSSMGVAAAILIAASLGGCATKGYVNDQVSKVDARVSTDDTRLSDHDAKLAQLDQTTREAMERAEAAGKLAEGKLASQPSLYKTALGWTGDMAGTTPELSVNKAGSLVVVFQNDAIGRDRWRQQFTIALRGGVLVIAGYDYEARDTLAPSHGGNCSINFLAGRGTRNGKPLKLAAAPIQLKDWNDAATPAACKFDD